MKKLSDTDIMLNHDLYKNFLEIGVDDGWTSEDKLGNFAQFLKICDYTKLPIEQASVLDVGSGTGDFSYFLHQHHVKQYIGIDIYEPAVDKARMKYEFADFISEPTLININSQLARSQTIFIVGDFLEMDLPQFDFVYSSGSTTTKFDTDNYLILAHWIRKMWKLSKHGIVFNVLLERYPNETDDENLYLYNRLKVLELAAKTVPESEMKYLIDDAGSGDGTEELHIYLYR